MGLELKQHLKMTQQLVMTPQLQQAIKLLQLSRMELVDLIRTEVTENPLLEGADDPEEEPVQSGDSPAEVADHEATPEHKEAEKAQEVKGEDGANEIDWDQYLDHYQLQGHTAPSNRNLSDEELPGYEATLTRKTDLFGHLSWQLRLTNLTPEEEPVAMLIIGNLDEDGYFKMPPVEGESEDAAPRDPLVRVAFEAGVGLELAERVLRRVQALEPLGVAARDLRECLMIQVRQLNADTPEIVAIIERHLKHLESKNYTAIAKDLKVSIDEVVKAVKVISRLEPKPGRAYWRGAAVHHARRVRLQDGREVRDGAERRRPLRCGSSDTVLPPLKNGRAGEVKEHIQEKLRSAVAHLAPSTSGSTIYKVTGSRSEFQRDFLDKDAYLKPLILRDGLETSGCTSPPCPASPRTSMRTPRRALRAQVLLQLRDHPDGRGRDRERGSEEPHQADRGGRGRPSPPLRPEDRGDPEGPGDRDRAPHRREVPRGSRDPALLEAHEVLLTRGAGGARGRARAAGAGAPTADRGRDAPQERRTARGARMPACAPLL
jgi:RNA polymerase sigma-54 factor